MRLISEEDVGKVGTVSFAGKSFGYIVKIISRFFVSRTLM